VILRILRANIFADQLAQVISKKDDPRLVHTVGCGGSHSIASHFTAELIGTFKDRTRKPYPSIVMFSDPSTTTAISNDFSFETIPERYIQSFARIPSILIAFTTSGNSKVIVNSLLNAQLNSMPTYLITGFRKDALAIKYADFVYHSEFQSVSEIQEDHLSLVHKICTNLEDL
tara:strand:+ start:1008 stop:1526 length:519 start_codon:yes stop_codon:yes gene_type:complete